MDVAAVEAPKKPLLRVNDVARRLNVSRSNVYQMMDRGDLPYLKFGKRPSSSTTWK